MTNRHKHNLACLGIGLLLPVASLLFGACNGQTVFHSFQSLPDRGWQRQDTVDFYVNVSDSFTAYRLEVKIRNNTDYPYQNLPLSVTTCNADTLQVSTDTLQLIANGLTTVPTHELLSFILDYVSKEPVERILVGLPKQMNNEASENMQRIEPFVRSLKKRLPDMPVEYVDERFTSVLAHRTMLEAGLKKKDRQNKALVDEISATIILQSYLENRSFR